MLRGSAPISCLSCHKIRLNSYFKCGRCGDVFKTQPLVDRTPDPKPTEREEIARESTNQKTGTTSHDVLGLNTIVTLAKGDFAVYTQSSYT